MATDTQADLHITGKDVATACASKCQFPDFPRIYIKPHTFGSAICTDPFYTKPVLDAMHLRKEGYIYDARSELTLQKHKVTRFVRSCNKLITHYPSWAKPSLVPLVHSHYASYKEFEKDKYKVCTFEIEVNSPLLLDLSQKDSIQESKVPTSMTPDMMQMNLTSTSQCDINKDKDKMFISVISDSK